MAGPTNVTRREALLASDTQPIQAPAHTALANWLTAHHLKYGLAGYWESNITTLASDGQVLPSPWKVLEHVKMSPFATKFHEIMIRNCAPTAATPGSTENG